MGNGFSDLCARASMELLEHRKVLPPDYIAHGAYLCVP
jgi:hypothetical protein